MLLLTSGISDQHVMPTVQIYLEYVCIR